MAELLLDVLDCSVDRFVVVGVELDKTGGAFRVSVLDLLERSLALGGVTRTNEDVVVRRDRGEQCRSVEANTTIGTCKSKNVQAMSMVATLPVIKMI